MDRSSFNILLDRLPQEWNGRQIDTDFQVGIQIFWILEDEELSGMERIFLAGRLLFGKNVPDNAAELQQAIGWFLSGWNTDKLPTGKVEQPVMDYQQDQWRIWTAFLRQYGINLNRKKLHFWEFMALLRNLEECSFTRVVDIRAKKLSGKISVEERKYYTEQKKIYALRSEKKQEYTLEQAKAIDEFDKLRQKRMGEKTDAEKERIAEFMKHAEK